MTDYKLYCTEAGITNRDMILELRQYFPRYGKATQSMITNPDKYGVMLTPKAEAVLVRRFGDCAGLSDGWEFIATEDLAHLKKRKPERRSKANKLTVRLDDSLFSQLRQLYDRTAFASMQDMVEAAIVEFVNKRAQ